jgi:hypothetical protein
MKQIGYYVFVWVWCVVIVSLGVVIAQDKAVQYKAASSYMPDVVTISKFVPDSGRLCLEPPQGGLLTCKKIGDVRQWFNESSKK